MWMVCTTHAHRVDSRGVEQTQYLSSPVPMSATLGLRYDEPQANFFR